jgi:hypothetical protein
MVLSASIIFTLGVVHLVYTFWGPTLTPRDPALQISMSQISPVITKETTMWRCWVGFNASHSMGLILFGLVFGFLALARGKLLFQSPFLLVVGLAMLGGFVYVHDHLYRPLRAIQIAANLGKNRQQNLSRSSGQKYPNNAVIAPPGMPASFTPLTPAATCPSAMHVPSSTRRKREPKSVHESWR